MGPLNGLLFLFAKMRPGDGGGAALKAAPPSVNGLFSSGPRTTRMLVGNEDEVGVAGSTFTDECGDLVLWCPDTDTAGEATEVVAEDVDDALECVWWWCGIDRIEDTEEDVDFLPRRPPEERR